MTHVCPDVRSTSDHSARHYPSSFHYYGQIMICGKCREQHEFPLGTSSGVKPSEEAFRFRCADRNTWMSLTDENHVMYYCKGQDNLTVK